MHSAPYIPGFPKRLGEDFAALFARDGYSAKRLEVVHQAQSHRGPVALTADEDSIYNAADRASRECYETMARCVTMDAGLLAIEELCAWWGVDVPESVSGEDREIVNKVVDLQWWRRQLRKVVARRVEHAAIMAGLVGKESQPYISDESCIRQAKRNQANRKMLEQTKVRNENGDEFALSELADKGTGNKEKRRHELMTRIRGFEEVAQLMNHAALFWTITCPSKFHAVGGKNPKYNGATPRDAQAYLVNVWAKIRAKLDREGIRPYGFRVVEPHTDGCPHWHMLFFVERKDVQRMATIVYDYAMEEDGDEAGAKENRVKLVTIQHGGGGYIAKYIAKNIDGHGVGEHKSFENGEEVTVKAATLENMVITPSMRVSYWSQVWGIRQFQQIAGVPVGIWREFRRIKESTIEGAPEVVRQAWAAAQAVKSENEEEAKQADFCGFMQALGGPRTGRATLIQLAKDEVTIDGKYARYEAKKPIGVYAVEESEVIYKSVRYVWERVEEKRVVPVGFGVPRTGVNNCTQFDYPELQNRFNAATEKLGEAAKNKKFSAPAWVDWPGVRQKAKEIEQETNKFAWRGNKHV
jgi:hypothetical protein